MWIQNNFKKFKKAPLIISTILLMFSCFLFFSLYKQTQDNNRAWAQSEMEWQNEANRRNEIKSLDRSLKVIEQERTLLDTHFAKSSDVVPFLDTIEKLASEAGVKAEVVLVDIPKDDSGLVVGINATGHFEGLYKFLTLLENSPYELDFISMNMQKLNIEIVSDIKTPDSEWSTTFGIKLLSFIP